MEAEPLLSVEAMERATLGWRRPGSGALVRAEAAAATAAKPEGVMVCSLRVLSLRALCTLEVSRAIGRGGDEATPRRGERTGG